MISSSCLTPGNCFSARLRFLLLPLRSCVRTAARLVLGSQVFLSPTYQSFSSVLSITVYEILCYFKKKLRAVASHKLMLCNALLLPGGKSCLRCLSCPGGPSISCHLCPRWACLWAQSSVSPSRNISFFLLGAFSTSLCSWISSWRGLMGSKAGAKYMAGTCKREQRLGRVGSPLSSGDKPLCQLTTWWKRTHRHLIGAVIPFSLLLSKAVFC